MNNQFASENKQKPGKADDSMNDKEWFQIYWNYFALMSGQRIQMINFYITIVVVLFGGFFTLISFDNRIHWAEYSVSLAIIFMSLTFFGIDYRTKTMIHKCEDLMVNIEKRYSDVFGIGPIQYINEWKPNEKIHMTYSKWFSLQFAVIGATGLMLFLLLFKNII